GVKATIEWGCGSAVRGTVTGSGGSYSVSGSHTYAEEGTYSISIDVIEDSTATATITGTATVADAALTGSTTASLSTTEGSSASLDGESVGEGETGGQGGRWK